MEKKLKVFPHKGVCTQLLASKVNKGKAGTFAMLPIGEGVNPFLNEDDTLFWVSEGKLLKLKLSRRVRQLYDRLGALEGDRRYTYPDFGNLPHSAYIADGGKRSNLYYGDDDKFRTKRKIKAGEELTVDYDTIG